jgi:hypothetical protein
MKLKKYLRRKRLVMKRWLTRGGGVVKVIAPRIHKDEPLIKTYHYLSKKR